MFADVALSVSMRLTVNVPANIVDNTITYTVNPAMTSTLTASNNPIDVGQTQLVTAGSIGGTANFNYNILVYNSIGLVTSSNSAFISGTSNTFTFSQSSSWGIGTFTVNLILTDSATSANMVHNTITYTVNPAMTSTPP